MALPFSTASERRAREHPSKMPGDLLQLPGDILALIARELPFASKKSLVESCSRAHSALPNLLKYSSICFVENKEYLSEDTGWVHYRQLYSVKLPKNAKRRGSTVVVGGKRRKVRMRGGVEYVVLGPNFKHPKLRANSTEYDMKEVVAHNTYWMENL